MKDRLWIAAAGATAAVVTATALAVSAAQGSGAVTEAEPRSEPPRTTKTCVGTRPVGSLPGPGAEVGPPDNTPLFRVLFYIDDRGASKYSDVFTGLSVDEDQNATDVWRIPSAAFDADLCGAAEKGVTVRLHDAVVNREDVDALVKRISDDLDRWGDSSHGFEIYTVGPDESGYVSVGVNDPAKARPALQKAYRDAGIEIRVRQEEQPTLG